MISLKDLYFAQIKDLYDVEHQLLDALPEMAEAVESQELKGVFRNHLQETRAQIERLEMIFEAHEMEAERETSKAMKALLLEGRKDIKNWEDAPAVRDAALIANAQRVEHYEIAGYGSVCSFAEILGFSDDVTILEEILDEEKNADEALADIAMNGVNEDALTAEMSSGLDVDDEDDGDVDTDLNEEEESSEADRDEEDALAAQSHI